MSIVSYNQICPNIPFKADVGLGTPLAKPIETVQKTIEDSVDTIMGDKNKKKKGKSTAIEVVSGVLVLSGFVALLNPRFSPKLIEKIKNLSKKASNKAKKNKDDDFLNKFYKFWEKASNNTVRVIQFASNFNSIKDILFKNLCTERKDFWAVTNKSARNVLKKIDSGFVKVLKKPYNAITKFFDKVSMHTVKSKYSSSAKKMDSLDQVLAGYKNRLTDVQKVEFEAKLAEISSAREYFTTSNLETRFTAQEESMRNLERDFMNRLRKYRQGITNKWTDTRDVIDKNLSFWAQEIVEPIQTKFETQGRTALERLWGDGKNQAGAYQRAFDIISPHLSKEEESLIRKAMEDAKISLQKANHSECVDYFGKKRDLILGSAPTDILTALVGLSLSGILLAKAENKDERISALLTKAFPVIGGIASSMILTAQLVSGPVGILSGLVIAFILNKIGSLTSKVLVPGKEVQNA